MSTPPPDELVRALSADGGVAVRAVVGTEFVAEATSRHEMAPTARAALGRALLGAVLLAVGGKDRESVQLEIRGNGPLKTLIAMSDPLGRARGYVANPTADPPPRRGRLDVAGAIGLGILTVSRRRPDWKRAHMGTVELRTSEVAQDLTHYLAESEQIPSAVGLGTGIDSRGEVEAAGGFLVQATPGADDDVLARVEHNVKALPSPSELVRSGHGGDALLDRLLEGVGSRERSRDTPRFHCPCTRERALRTLQLLGRDELSSMIAERETQEVRCQFCGQRYDFAPAALEWVRAAI